MIAATSTMARGDAAPVDVRHLAYFVHDLGDAAVARRVAMLQSGGMRVTLVGFHRHDTPPATLGGAVVIDLGKTRDGRMAHRIMAVLKTLVRLGRVRDATRSCDAIMARNLEMLVIAACIRGHRRLVYECLDIHRLLLGNGLMARAVQAIERRMLHNCDLVITSSQRFIDSYFQPRRLTDAPILLVENKVLALTGARVTPATPPPGPPWVIGWFGMLRCRRSLRILLDIVREGGGRVELVLAGIPSDAEFGDLDAILQLPGVRFLGRYGAEDLPSLYGGVHFAWAIDYFEEGLNSVWLMPNRLYEALAHGAVPIALAEVETGAWLRRHGVGVVVDVAANDVPALLNRMTPDSYAALRTSVAAIAPEAVTNGPDACAALVVAIADGRLPAAAI